MRSARQHGGVTLLLVMVLLVISAFVGVLAVRGSGTELRMAGAQREGRSRFYCAEAGINASRGIFAANYGQWPAIWAGGTPVGFTYPVTGDLDGDGQPDYSVTIKDNYDEFPVSNPLTDSDQSAILVSTCISTTLSVGSRQVQQIVTYNGPNGGCAVSTQLGSCKQQNTKN